MEKKGYAEDEIRTRAPFRGPVFKTGALDRSATSAIGKIIGRLKKFKLVAGKAVAAPKKVLCLVRHLFVFGLLVLGVVLSALGLKRGREAVAARAAGPGHYVASHRVGRHVC